MRYLFVGIVALATLTACSESASNPGGDGGAGGAGGSGGMEEQPPRQDPSAARPTTAMNVSRSRHTATLLRDRRVLVVGGEAPDGTPLTSVEIFDPTTETWTELEALPVARSNHTTTLLADDTLLIAGGAQSNQNGSPSPDGVIASAVVYQVGAGAVQQIPMNARAGHDALLLPDGRVLIVGGSSDEVGSACTQVPNCFYGKALATAETYDPTSNTFTATTPMAGPRMLFGSLLLDDGSPLIVGGATDTASLASVEAFTDEAFVARAPLDNARFRPTVVRLGTGFVVAAAGKIANVGPIGTTEIYNPTSNSWTPGPDIGAPRTGAPAVTLQSGNALVVGGYNQTDGSYLDELLLFDAASTTWKPLPPMTTARAVPSVTLLHDGRVLIAGGLGAGASCEVAE